MRTTISYIILTSLLCVSTLNSIAQPALQKIWECKTGLSTPESVIFDKQTASIFVANIQGKSAEKDSAGYISQLSLEGDVLDSVWVDGLNAPKGMAIRNRTLYVADIDRVVAIDIKLGRISGTYYGQGANFLNDIAITETGNLFVSDTRQGRIYRLNGDSLELWKNDTLNLKRVNGLYAANDTLFAGTANEILAFPNSSVSHAFIKLTDSTGFIDGLERWGIAWVYSDWSGHVTYQNGNEKTIILDTTEDKINAADIQVVGEKSLLLIPTFFFNSVSAYKISHR